MEEEKSKNMKEAKAGLALLLVVLSFPLLARAYVDPGAGSMLLQLLLGGVAGAAVLGKLYWKKLMGLFGRGRATEERLDPESSSNNKTAD